MKKYTNKALLIILVLTLCTAFDNALYAAADARPAVTWWGAVKSATTYAAEKTLGASKALVGALDKNYGVSSAIGAIHDQFSSSPESSLLSKYQTEMAILATEKAQLEAREAALVAREAVIAQKEFELKLKEAELLSKEKALAAPRKLGSRETSGLANLFGAKKEIPPTLSKEPGSSRVPARVGPSSPRPTSTPTPPGRTLPSWTGAQTKLFSRGAQKAATAGENLPHADNTSEAIPETSAEKEDPKTLAEKLVDELKAKIASRKEINEDTGELEEEKPETRQELFTKSFAHTGVSLDLLYNHLSAIAKTADSGAREGALKMIQDGLVKMQTAQEAKNISQQIAQTATVGLLLLGCVVISLYDGKTTDKKIDRKAQEKMAIEVKNALDLLADTKTIQENTNALKAVHAMLENPKHAATISGLRLGSKMTSPAKAVGFLHQKKIERAELIEKLEKSLQAAQKALMRYLATKKPGSTDEAAKAD